MHAIAHHLSLRCEIREELDKKETNFPCNQIGVYTKKTFPGEFICVRMYDSLRGLGPTYGTPIFPAGEAAVVPCDRGTR